MPDTPDHNTTEWRILRKMLPKMPDTVIETIIKGGGIGSFGILAQQELRLNAKAVGDQIVALGTGQLYKVDRLLPWLAGHMGQTPEDLMQGEVEGIKPAPVPLKPPSRRAGRGLPPSAMQRNPPRCNNN